METEKLESLNELVKKIKNDLFMSKNSLDEALSEADVFMDCISKKDRILAIMSYRVTLNTIANEISKIIN